MIETDEKVVWKFNSSEHDWCDGVLLKRFLDKLLGLSLIDDMLWLRKADGESIDKHCTVEKINDLMDECLNKSNETVEFEMGGSDWTLFINLYPYHSAEQRVQGLNTIFLTFNRDRLQSANAEQNLRDAFTDLYDGDNTEYAVIHPYRHWLEFADIHYEAPVTIGPMFNGVFWLNFIGGNHYKEFDGNELKKITADKMIFASNGGLFFCLGCTLRDLENDDSSEQELLRLNGLFKAALKADSLWRL